MAKVKLERKPPGDKLAPRSKVMLTTGEAASLLSIHINRLEQN